MERKKKKLANSVLEGGIQNRNAFTLIELLAIIVILAIIAVITVPIILNVIENSKKGAAKDSAYGYKDAVNKYYVTKLSEDSNIKLSGTYMVEEDGTIQGMDLDTKSYTDKLDISVSGTTPTGGYLNYENSILKDGCLTMDEYKVTIENGEVTRSEKGACESVSLTACDSLNFDPSPESWFRFDSSTGTIMGFSDEWNEITDPNIKKTDITIPCEIGGKAVTNIGAGYFTNKGLTSVIISDSVIKLESGSFNANSELTLLVIGESVEEINDSAFYNCNIKNLVLPNSIKTIGSMSFQNNGLKSVTFGENIKSIGNQAFYINELKELIIPKNVESIGSAAFIDNDLTSIVINSDDITIAQPAFWKSSTSNSNLTTIYNNTGKEFDWYSIINGTSSTKFEIGTVENSAGNVVITKSN